MAPITIHVKSTTGEKFTVEAETSITVNELKHLLETQCGVPADQQRLIYKGHVLKEHMTVESYGVEDQHTIHMVRRVPQPEERPPGAVPSHPSTTSAAPPPAGNPFGMFGGFGMPGTTGGMPPTLQQMQQQFLGNPELMNQVMGSPMFQSLINNPEMMHQMLMTNPQIREVIERNPEVGHVLNDPQLLRQTMEAARNPSLMRELMRTTDGAMRNVERHPEGYNALRRMYETVQEPMLNAATESARAAANPFAALFGGETQQQQQQPQQQQQQQPQQTPTTDPLPNPWATLAGTQGTGIGTPPTTGTPGRSAGTTGTAGTTPFPFMGGMGEMPGMNANALNQMMQNPAVSSMVSQMIQQMLSNPDAMNSLLNANPQLRSMAESNPQLRESLSNPETLRQLADPRVLQSMIQLMSAMGQLQQTGLFGAANNPMMQPTTSTLPTTTTTTTATTTTTEQGQTTPTQPQVPTSADFAALLQQMTGAPPPQQVTLPPQERFSPQLAQLRDMGFGDLQANINALLATNGNVQLAIERLLGDPQ